MVSDIKAQGVIPHRRRHPVTIGQRLRFGFSEVSRAQGVLSLYLTLVIGFSDVTHLKV